MPTHFTVPLSDRRGSENICAILTVLHHRRRLKDNRHLLLLSGGSLLVKQPRPRSKTKQAALMCKVDF